MIRSSRSFMMVTVFGLAFSACKGLNQEGAKTLDAGVSNSSNVAVGNRDKPALCVGVRGNGQLITAHWQSMASIMETHGAIEGMAGGSSGSITSFLYESMNINKAMMACSDNDASACSMKRGAKLALGMKSLFGVLESLGETDDVLALRELIKLEASMKASHPDLGNAGTVGGLLKQGQAVVAAAKIRQILTSSNVRALISDQVWTTLNDATTGKTTQAVSLQRINSIYVSLSSLTKFKADSAAIFLRTPVLNFDRLSELFGRIADFYAERGAHYSKDVMDAFYGSCGQGTAGQPWPMISARPLTLPAQNSLKLAATANCGDAFRASFTQYWKNYDALAKIGNKRVDEPVGKYLPMMISTSILKGKAAYNELTRAREAFAKTGEEKLNINFDDVKFGYWGQQAELDRVKSNIDAKALYASANYKFEGESRSQLDAKSEKFYSLGAKPWKQALTTSPAEPGLSSIVDIEPGDVASAGGWSDLHPVLVLQNMGCQKTVYITRQGKESDFSQGVAKLLGMQEGQQTEMMFGSQDLAAKGDKESSFIFSMRMADAIWCTNWNVYNAADLKGVIGDAIAAPYYIRDEWASKSNIKGVNVQPFSKWQSCLAEIPKTK